MGLDHLLLLGIFLLGGGALVGFFKSKTKGFGRFTTSVLLILLVITISSLLFVAGKINQEFISNILFAVFGFAGGLFTAKGSKDESS